MNRINKTVAASILCLTAGCALNPRAEIGIGPSLHDNTHYTNGRGVVGDVSLSLQPIPKADWFRLGVQHISDPTTFNDAGTTWGKAYLTFGN